MSCYDSKMLVEWLSGVVSSVEKTSDIRVYDLGWNNQGVHMRVEIENSVSADSRISWHVLETAARFSWVNRELGVVKPPEHIIQWMFKASLDECFDTWNSLREF